MEHIETGYQPLHLQNASGDETPQEIPPTHIVPDTAKKQWNHIGDLDNFFKRLYTYHQKHGFGCIFIKEILDIIMYIFIIVFIYTLVQCVDYPILFKDKIVSNSSRVSLNDVMVCRSMSGSMTVVIITASVVLIVFIGKAIYKVFQFLEIKSFFSTALEIQESDIENCTWADIQRRLQEVQRTQQMYISRQELTPLDIYHRILRFTNYMVAMINKNVLPVKYQVPLVGEYVYFTKALRFSIELILFRAPGAPFENNWQLKDDYKKYLHRNERATALSKRILWFGIIALILCVPIFVSQFVYFFLNYAEILKREPGTFGLRKWSLYGRYYTRHWNELDHELNARLSRGYKPAVKYMSCFTSSKMAVLARFIMFIACSFAGVIFALTLYDEDVLQVEHILSIFTALSVLIACCRSLIPEQHLICNPEIEMMKVRAHIVYTPRLWHGSSHTTSVRNEFAHLFQYKAAYVLEELLSPILTPLILIFYLRPKSLDIVDFLRNFTVEVNGIGDVCSFAQLDVKKHGHPQWITEQDETVANQYEQAEDGKTEHSLMHFKWVNPTWEPKPESARFIHNLEVKARKDFSLQPGIPENPLYYSLNSLSCLGPGYSGYVGSMMRQKSGLDLSYQPQMDTMRSFLPGTSSRPFLRGALSHIEGSIDGSNSALLTSIHPSSSGGMMNPSAEYAPCSPNLDPTTCGDNDQFDVGVADMSFTTLYMHQLHHQRQRLHRSYMDEETGTLPLWRRPVDVNMPEEMPHEESEHGERAPLLNPHGSR